MYELPIDPQRLLRVRFLRPDGSVTELVVLTCAYVSVMTSSGTRAVAVHLTWDPQNQNPTAPYSCPEENLTKQVISPHSLQLVSPFLS